MAEEALDTTGAVQAYLQGPDVATRARASLSQASGSSGELEAELRRVSERTGVPISTARAMPAEVKRRSVAADDYEELTRRFPNTMGFLADPNNAKLAHDDRDNLTALETVLREGAFAGRSAAAGLPALSGGIAGVGQALFEAVAPIMDPLVGTVLPGNPLRGVAAGLAGMRRDATTLSKEVAGPLPPDAGLIRRGVQSGFQSVGQQLPAMVASIYSGNPAFMLGSAGVGEGGKAYGEARDKGASPLGALIYGSSQAAIEIGTEKIPVARLLGDLKAGSSLFKTLVRQVAVEVPGEQVATLLQDLNEWAVLNPEKPFSAYLAERPAAAAQTLVATITGVGVQTGAAHAAAKVAGTLGKQDRATQDAETVQRVVEAAGQSKLRERDPNAFAELVQQTAASAGAPTEVFLDAREIAAALQQSGITVEQAAAAMPSLRGQFEEALATGGDVILPLGEFAAGIAGSPLEQALAQHARTDVDALSQKEAKAAPAADKQMADAAKQAEPQEADTTERDAVRKTVLDQLNATKRFTPDVNEAYADLTATVLTNLARRTGKTVKQMYAEHPLTVQASGTFGEALQQQAVDTPAFRKWFGDSKVVDAQGKPLVVYHGAPDASFVQQDGIFKAQRDRIGMGEAEGAFWFASSLDTAKSYADDRRAFDYQAAKPGVVEAYLKMANPLIVEANGAEWRDAQRRGKTSDVIQQARADGHDGVIIRAVKDDYINDKRTKPTDTYVVFNSTQIKSATGNRGTFDPADQNILKQATQAKPSPAHIDRLKREKVLSKLLECLRA